MRLNPVNGKAALGIATNISVDGVIPAPLVGVGALFPRWYDPAGNVLLYFNNDDGNLSQIDLDTDVVTVVAAGGATVLAAGNNLYVAAVSAGAFQGVRSNIPGWVTKPLAGLGDMDENGDVCLIQAFAADNGIQLYDSAGTLVATYGIPVSASAVIRCKTGIAAFATSGPSWQLRALATGAVIPFAQRTQGVIETVPIELASGEVWVIERTGDDTLTARPATANQGYVLSSTIVFNPDVIELTPGVLRIGWSATAGEGPTALRMADLTIATGAQTLWSTSTGTLVSSAGPTLPISSLPATMTEQGLLVGFLNDAPFTYPNGPRGGWLTTEFGVPFLSRLLTALGQPVNLETQTTGTIPPDLSVLNGANIIAGSTPLTALESQAASTLVGRGSASAGSPEVITLGSGLTMTLTELSASGGSESGYWSPLCAGPAYNFSHLVAASGYWSPLMTGPDAATSELVLTAEGDTVSLWTQTQDGPYLPPIVVSEDSTIAVWTPTP